MDASNIERNLYLTMQLMELDVPMVLALNMMDEVRENGGSIRVNEMEAHARRSGRADFRREGRGHRRAGFTRAARRPLSGAPLAVRISATRRGTQAAVHRCLHGIMHLIEDHAEKAGIPPRFAASKLAEGDRLVLEQLNLSENEKEMLEHIIVQMEQERGLDRAAAIADMRFSFIEKVCSQTVVRPHESHEHARSVKADRILTGKYTAIPMFVAHHGWPCSV